MNVPKELQQRITREGGRSPNGRPLFRISWGEHRLCWIGGPWAIVDDHGNQTGVIVEERKVPKYPEAVDRFVFEAWMPPEFYGTPESWESQFTQHLDGKRICTLGPFPREGDYELLKVLETPSGQFVPLTETIVSALLEVSKVNRTISTQARLNALHDRMEMRQKELAAKRECIMDDCYTGSPWGDSPHVIVPDLKEVKAYG